MVRHAEKHRTQRIGWLRAAVLGANDGIVSTASLIVGVAAAEASRSSVLVAGVAGLVAGAMSMAAGEYVSVSSQSDTNARIWTGSGTSWPRMATTNTPNWPPSMSPADSIPNLPTKWPGN